MNRAKDKNRIAEFMYGERIECGGNTRTKYQIRIQEDPKTGPCLITFFVYKKMCHRLEGNIKTYSLLGQGEGVGT